MFSFAVGVGPMRLYRAGRLRAFKAPSLVSAFMLAAPQAAPALLENWVYEVGVAVFVFPLIIAASANAEPAGQVAGFVGQLSHPRYIVHYAFVPPFSHFAGSHDLNGATLFAWVTLAIGVMLGATILATKAYDEPLRRWLSERLRNQPFWNAHMASASNSARD